MRERHNLHTAYKRKQWQGCCLTIISTEDLEPRRAKAEKLGAQKVMCWELLQNI